MKKKSITFLGLISLFPISFVLSSCASSSQSLPVVKISFTNTTLNGKSLDNDELAIGYNPYNRQPIVYRKDSSSNDGKPYSPITPSSNIAIQTLMSKIILPTIDFSNKLVDVSHVSPKSNTNSIFKENLIFDSSYNNELLKEFILASANILNQGRRNQIKLSLSNVKFTLVNDEINPQISSNKTFEINDIYNVEPIYNVPFKFVKLSDAEPTDDDKKNWEKKSIYYKDENGILKRGDAVNYAKFLKNFSSNLVYESNETTYPTYNIQLTYKYFNPENNDPFKESVKLKDIENYVLSTNAWNGYAKPTKDEFTLNYNLKFKMRTQYTTSNVGYIILNDNVKISDQQRESLAKTTIKKDDGNIEEDAPLTENNTNRFSTIENKTSNLDYLIYLNKTSNVVLNSGVLYTPKNFNSKNFGSFLEMLNNFSITNSDNKYDSSDKWSNLDVFSSDENGVNKLINFIPKNDNVDEYIKLIGNYKGMLSLV